MFGDLRLIRNDVVHKGVADEAARCKVLRWFEKGRPVEVRLGHVFDFLNHLGLIGGGMGIKQGGTGASFWHELPPPPKEKGLTIPPLVSDRPILALSDPPQFRFAASVVLADAVHGQIPFGPIPDEAQAASVWKTMRISREGELDVPGIALVSRADIYRSLVHGERIAGPGLPGPMMRFRE